MHSRPPRPLLFALIFQLCAFAAWGQQQNALLDRQDTHVASSRELAPSDSLAIAGPLRSMERMAGISQQAAQEEILPLLARNIYVQGYVGWLDQGRPTEFLTLLGRYVNQAEELSKLAEPQGQIRVTNCTDVQPLLRVLGYDLRGECGHQDLALVTSDQERAFLTSDSGFPLAALEVALRTSKPFEYHFPESRVPVIFEASDWINLARGRAKWRPTFVESLLHHPTLARLYWAMSRMDPETRAELKKSPGLARLLKDAPELDYYGSHIVIRQGRVVVPGGTAAEGQWKSLVGASPDSSADFVEKLLAKDKGWLGAFYDCFARISPEQQAHFVQGKRLEMAYTAFRGPKPTADAARPAFRLASGLLLLLNRLQWDAQGNPVIPGDVAMWKQMLSQKSQSKAVREWGKHSGQWANPDQVLQAMFAFSRVDGERTPLRMFLLFSELDSRRTADRKLSPHTLELLAAHFEEYQDQYLLFSEFPALDDSALTAFVSSADAIESISNRTLRGNAMGTFQAEVGLWQILARQQQIPSEKLNSSWASLMQQFAHVSSSTELFNAGTGGLQTLTEAALGKQHASQDEVIELLAGPQSSDAEARRVHEEMARAIRAVMDGQRLVSLDTLQTLGQGLDDMARGEKPASSMVTIAGQLQEFQMPRPIFTSSERSEWAAGVYNNRHTEIQMQTDLAKVFRTPPSHKKDVEEAKGELAPFLRDTLVGLNYAYYQPPGSQLLRINPLFVRSHDFSGETVAGVEDLWQEAQVFGQGTPAGGGAHLVGSLADLPYVLSEAEQDFITPENVQALIWREAVPGLLTDAIMPRWWHVTRNEMHAVALYQRAGEELVQSSASNADLRNRVLSFLSDRMPPATLSRLQVALETGDSATAVALMTPADTFFLTADFRQHAPQDSTAWGPAGQELNTLTSRFPSELAWSRLSRDFGVPHEEMQQTYARDLLNTQPFPAFSGFSSRLMAECWDSNNLYWARLADEMNYSPVTLNLLVPELTRRMVEKIFATDFEDWPALLRAMRETGHDFRAGKIGLPSEVTAFNRVP
jgi:hypothetical protein